MSHVVKLELFYFSKRNVKVQPKNYHYDCFDMKTKTLKIQRYVSE